MEKLMSYRCSICDARVCETDGADFYPELGICGYCKDEEEASNHEMPTSESCERKV